MEITLDGMQRTGRLERGFWDLMGEHVGEHHEEVLKKLQQNTGWGVWGTCYNRNLALPRWHQW